MESEVATIVAVVTAIIGPIAVYYVTNRKNALIKKEWSDYKKAESQSGSYLNIDYGIKITSPRGETVSEDWMDISGIYSIMPPPETLRLYTFNPNRTNYGERFWPQQVVKEFFPETKTWRARAPVGGLPKGGGVLAAIVSQPAIVLWDYYYKVGPKMDWWDIEGWPSDSPICDRVVINRP